MKEFHFGVDSKQIYNVCRSQKLLWRKICCRSAAGKKGYFEESCGPEEGCNNNPLSAICESKKSGVIYFTLYTSIRYFMFELIIFYVNGTIIRYHKKVFVEKICYRRQMVAWYIICRIKNHLNMSNTKTVLQKIFFSYITKKYTSMRCIKFLPICI